MPINYLRGFTQPVRTEAANRRLGCSLAFVAGAANAGGFLAVGQYTSHMSGIVASLSDDLVLGQLVYVLTGVSALLAFLFGAATSSILINWGRRHQTHSAYAAPLLLEAALLIGFGLLGASLEHHRWLFASATVALLCYVMGLQNAIITKISKAEIRTTHVTGLVTDIGIELGKMLYWNRPGLMAEPQRVAADQGKLRLLASLLGMFFLGGVAGALGFKHLGFVSTVPLALILIMLAIVPLLDDISHRPMR
ncbi:membrane protein [Pandoraea iniqua]|uniref:Membrane protein n=1 Tax=Pandoraea iniqua TaxID=2508288 RepID=A0A5E4W6Q7_9BURK|nr:YoaK family protein [Pandoraea iniqua]VVE12258.1 membrane protein [Pandoraea iniqua]VVE20392.1 membrane protein [Pandoraea iniqua]